MSNGGGILPDEISTKESQNALKFYADLRNKYHVAPQKSESASATMAQMFIQGRIAMYLSGRWMVPKLRQECKFDWDIVSFPNGTKGSVVQLDASGWAISKSSKHKEQSKRLINYLSSKQSSQKFTKSGLIVPARVDVSIIDNEKPQNAQVFTDIIKISAPTKVNKDYAKILDDVKKKNEKIFSMY